MLKNRLLASACLALVIPGLAFAKDKIQGTMTQPLDGLFVGASGGAVAPGTPVSSAYVREVTKTKFKVDAKCKIQVQLKKMTGLADTDQDELTADGIWCIGYANATLDNPAAPGTNIAGAASIAINMEIKKDGAKAKTSVQEIAELVLGEECAGATLTDINVACYEPDGAYDPAAECGSLPGLAIPHPGGLPQVICITSPAIGLPYAFLSGPSSDFIAGLGANVP